MPRIVSLPEVEQCAGHRPAAPRQDGSREHERRAGDAGLEERGAKRRAALEVRTFGLGFGGQVIVVVEARGSGHQTGRLGPGGAAGEQARHGHRERRDGESLEERPASRVVRITVAHGLIK
jgi:hypothetical protein